MTSKNVMAYTSEAKKPTEYIGQSYSKTRKVYAVGGIYLLKGRSVVLQAVLCTSIWYVGSLVLISERVEKTK